MWFIQIIKKIKHSIFYYFNKDNPQNIIYHYAKLFNVYAFIDGKCNCQEQFEASIIRLYHTIEKGLSYENYRAGFGKINVELLINSLFEYSKKYNIDSFAYQTAISCLKKYVEKNNENGLIDKELEHRINNLPGVSNHCGGVIEIVKPCFDNILKMNYEELVTTRHSIRHFANEPVDIELIKKAIALSQYTPSACNRQAWKTRIIANKEIISKILTNQNGNKGFGQEIDKLLIISCDIRYFQKNRECFQVFIDGGMYAESIINSVYYYGIGSIPLSASLLKSQEEKIRQIIGMHEAEKLILFIGVGNYPEKCLTTRSERKPIQIEVY